MCVLNGILFFFNVFKYKREFLIGIILFLNVENKKVGGVCGVIYIFKEGVWIFIVFVKEFKMVG